MSAVAVLCYHAIGGITSGPDRPFSVEPEVFATHVEALAGNGWRFAMFGELCRSRSTGAGLPKKTAVLTFDDGFASVLHHGVPIMERFDAMGTAFVTTSFLSSVASTSPDRYLTAGEVGQLAAAGVEVGGHGHHHLAHDLATEAELASELGRSKTILSELTSSEVASYAYPYGYSTPLVRSTTRHVGYRGACGVRHALSGAADDPLDVARIRVMRTTTAEKLLSWVEGSGVRTSPCSDQLMTRAYRPIRHARHRVKRFGER